MDQTNHLPRALSEASIRAIVREHSDLCRMLGEGIAAEPMSDWDFSGLMARALLNVPEIFNDIVSHGLGCSREEASQMGLFPKITVLQDIMILTRDAYDKHAWATILHEELIGPSAPPAPTRH